MYIFDSIVTDRLTKIKKKLSGLRSKHRCVNLKYFKYDETELDKVVLVCGINKFFFDIEVLDFLLRKKKVKEVDIVFAVKCNQYGHLQDTSFATSWLNEFAKNEDITYKVAAVVDDSDQEYLLDLLRSFYLQERQTKKRVYTVYTDGSCLGNPGEGGWGAIVMQKGCKPKEISGSVANTTNNRMEILSVVQALELIKRPSKVTVYSDSAYVVNTFNLNWIDQWKKSKWRNSEKLVVKNVDLWQKLDSLVNFHEVEFIKVKGHADDYYNNRCDELAVNASKKLQAKLKKEAEM